METNKNRIRKEALLNRKSISRADWLHKSEQIADRICDVKEFADAKSVLIYASYNNEVETDKLILKAMLMGKEIYMPKVDGDDMDFYRVFSLDELEEGAFGIREPYDIEHFKFEQGENTVCIMPLAAFDNAGNRVGYGKGYYDKYLSRTNVNTLIGLAFECQKTSETIIADEFDKKLNYVITEKTIYKF